MKKVLSRVFMGLNIVLIICLLLLSGLTLSLSNATPRNLFGYSALIQNGSDSDTSLLIYRKADKPQPGDAILFRPADGKVALYTVTETTDRLAYFTDESGETVSADLSLPEYLGTVRLQSDSLGRILAALSSPDHRFVSYFTIGAGFLLCVIILLFIYTLSHRPEKAEETSDDNLTVNMTVVPDKPPLKEPPPPQPEPAELPALKPETPAEITIPIVPVPEPEEDVKIYQLKTCPIKIEPCTRRPIPSPQSHSQKPNQPSIEELMWDIQKQLSRDDELLKKADQSEE